MILRTVKQARRVFLMLAGFTLLLSGTIMVATPVPGLPVILLGLGLLGAEFVWAQQVLDRVKRQTERLRDVMLRSGK